jgi:hypothetical protein
MKPVHGPPSNVFDQVRLPGGLSMELKELVVVIQNGARGAIERSEGLKAGLEPEGLLTLM